MKADEQIKGSYTSLMLTGDVAGIRYIKKTVQEIPQNTFNFCCTIDGTQNYERDMSRMKPEKNYDKERERMR